MTLKIGSEKFELVDVEDIDIKGELALVNGEKEDKSQDAALRCEDEAFIKEFLQERVQRINEENLKKTQRYISLDVWQNIMTAINTCQIYHWIKMEYKKKENQEALIKPELEYDDTVNNNSSLFRNLSPFDALKRRLCYETDRNKPEWEWLTPVIIDEFNKYPPREKSLQEMRNIYTDFSKMNMLFTFSTYDEIVMDIKAKWYRKQDKTPEGGEEEIIYFNGGDSYNAVLHKLPDPATSFRIEAEQGPYGVITDGEGKKNVDLENFVFWIYENNRVKLEDGKETNESGVTIRKYRWERATEETTYEYKIKQSEGDFMVKITEDIIRPMASCGFYVLFNIVVSYYKSSSIEDVNQGGIDLQCCILVHGDKEEIQIGAREKSMIQKYVSEEVHNKVGQKEISGIRATIETYTSISDIQWNAKIVEKEEDQGAQNGI